LNNGAADGSGFYDVRDHSAMKLGLLTDIHTHVYHLQAALDRLQAERVDQVVVLGDVIDLFGRFDGIEETCRLLAEANAAGMWGNHDYGLCVEPDAGVRSRYPAAVLEFMATLRPRLELGGCFFSHIEPWLNPEYMPDLWYGGGPPDSPDKLARIFNAVPHRMIFAGHYHTWLAATPDGVIGWDGTTRLVLDKGRHFIVVGALCEGNFATFDTVTAELVPMTTRK
jgi:hypothetical protein